MRIGFALLLVLAAVPAFAQNAVLMRADTLRAEPFADAQVVVPAAAGQSLRVIEQKGTWSLVEANARRGWIRGLNLRLAGALPARAEGVAALQTGRQAKGGIAVPLAIRGIGTPGGPAARLLKDLFEKRDAGAAVRASAGQAAEGRMKVNIESNRSGYAYVFMIEAAGDSLQCLFPNAGQPDNEVSADKPMTFSAELTANAAAHARERVKLLTLVSPQPIDLVLPDKQVEGDSFRVRVTSENRTALAAALSGCAPSDCPGYGAILLDAEFNR